MPDKKQTETPEPPQENESASAAGGGWARRLWREWVRPVLPVVLTLLAVRSSLADWNDVPTGSMKPTILEGDRIFVNKLAYDLKVPFTGWSLKRLDDPQRGEIIVFASPDQGTRMVKRVIGVPGDTIDLRDNTLFVNSEPVQYDELPNEMFPWISAGERYNSRFRSEELGELEHPIMLNQQRSSPRRSLDKPITLKSDEYYVMGDNRDNSSDSRVWGVVSRDRIAGRATRVVLSVDTEDWSPRWGRFFSPLQ